MRKIAARQTMVRASVAINLVTSSIIGQLNAWKPYRHHAQAPARRNHSRAQGGTSSRASFASWSSFRPQRAHIRISYGNLKKSCFIHERVLQAGRKSGNTRFTLSLWRPSRRLLPQCPLRSEAPRFLRCSNMTSASRTSVVAPQKIEESEPDVETRDWADPNWSRDCKEYASRATWRERQASPIIARGFA